MTIEEFKNIDPTFSESMFLTKVNNIFVKLFTNIMMDRLDEVKHFISEDVYNYGNSIIEQVKSRNARQMYDELNVKESSIQFINVNEDVYEIHVLLQSRYMDYLISLDTGDYISGNNSSRIQVNYLLTFQKKRETKNQSIARRCPGCGAPISVNTSGKCEFCNAIYNQEDYDWVLVKLERC